MPFDPAKYDFVPIGEPLSDRERVLFEQLEILRKSYEQAARPFVDELTKLRGLKAPRYMMVPKGDNDG